MATPTPNFFPLNFPNSGVAALGNNRDGSFELPKEPDSSATLEFPTLSVNTIYALRSLRQASNSYEYPHMLQDIAEIFFTAAARNIRDVDLLKALRDNSFSLQLRSSLGMKYRTEPLLEVVENLKSSIITSVVEQLGPFNAHTKLDDFRWCQDQLNALHSAAEGNFDLTRNAFVSLVMSIEHGNQITPRVYSIWSTSGVLRTLDELKVMEFEGIVREKPEWERKVMDETIVAKWRDEAYAQDFTPSMFDYAIAELRWTITQRDAATGIIPSIVPDVFHSDSLISSEDLKDLQTGADALTNVPDKYKDWHPESNQQVLDLVHPSLYAYVRGRTRRILAEPYVKPASDASASALDVLSGEILRIFGYPVPHRRFASPMESLSWAGRGSTTTAAPEFLRIGASFEQRSAMRFTSRRQLRRGQEQPEEVIPDPLPDVVEQMWPSLSDYLWLPVDFEVSQTGVVQFLSYINNLHPDPSLPSGKLYPVLGRILSRFLPLFEEVLSSSQSYSPRQEFLHERGQYWDPAEPEEPPQIILENGQVTFLPTRKVIGALHPDLLRFFSETEYDWERGEQLQSEWEANRVYIRPVVGPFIAEDRTKPPHGMINRQRMDLSGRNLQVIIKMASIHLTPEKPEYPGGSWHVEGTDNEQIVATGIYYFDTENITESTLSFRQATQDPENYQQGQHEHLRHLYGIENYGPANQELGSVKTSDGRCLCFPNSMQHRVSSFRLQDPTKPGHRKILVFFLVNPGRRILSTSDVPPQRLDWSMDQVRKNPNTRLTNLPVELFDEVSQHAEEISATEKTSWLMSLEEAKEHRLKIMDERRAFSVKVNGQVYERNFNLCEH